MQFGPTTSHVRIDSRPIQTEVYKEFFKNCSSYRQVRHAPTQNTEPMAELHG